MKTWLVLDCNYLCHRAYYTTGGLKYGDMGTGVAYGFMRDILSLQSRFMVYNMAFCFDSKSSLRSQACETYKQTRRTKIETMSAEDFEGVKEFRRQVSALRREHLPDLGYLNIFQEIGYEADDLIASIVLNLPKKEDAIIVSSDHDLYQLLSPRVSIYNPYKQTIMTEASFSEQYKVSPLQWIDVKAIAGCSSDDVHGIPGVGELTACKFLGGQLKPESKKHQAIVQGNKTWKQNMKLVRLPYPGCPVPVLRSDNVTEAAWRNLSNRLGFTTLQDGVAKQNKVKGFGL